MTPALLTYTVKETIDKNKFASICMDHVLSEGYFPITKEPYERLTNMSEETFLNTLLPLCSKVYVFTNYGINSNMSKIISRAVTSSIDVVYVELSLNDEDLTHDLSDILKSVCEKESVSIEDVLTKTRKREIVDARFIFFRRAREVTKGRVSYQRIGQQVGNKDHASVMWGIKQTHEIRELAEKYESYYGQK